MTKRDELIKSLKEKYEQERREAEKDTTTLRPTPSQTEADLAFLGHNVVNKIPTNAKTQETVLVEMPREMADDLMKQVAEQEKEKPADQVAKPSMMVDEDVIHPVTTEREMAPAQTSRGYETREARTRRKKSDEESNQ